MSRGFDLLYLSSFGFLSTCSFVLFIATFGCYFTCIIDSCRWTHNDAFHPITQFLHHSLH